MGRRTRRIAVGAAVTMLAVSGVAAAAGGRPTKVRAPKIGRITASAANNRASIAVSINPEGLESSFQLALVYRPANCCPPGSKECCTPEVEVVSTGKIAAGSTPHELHGGAKLREGSYSVRVRVEADNSAGSSEKSRALRLPRH